MVERWAFASPSARPFAARGMKLKQQKEKGESEEKAKESISDRIPKRSIVYFLCDIAWWRISWHSTNAP